MDGKTLGLAIGLTAAAAFGVGMAILYGGGPPPAPPRPQPPSAADVGTALKYSPALYRAMLEQDARSFGVPVLRPADLARPFPYFKETPGSRRLKPGMSTQTAHLRIGVVVRKEAGSVEGQTYRADHVLLRLENLTQNYLAYRVETAVADERRCDAKGDAPHNAIVLEPGQTILRTECLLRPVDETVELKSVEVMELPALSAYYVSRLAPGLILYSPRTSAGHVPLKGSICPQTFSWRDVRDGAERGLLGWRDIIDFYARHNCEEYAFFPTYRYRTDPGAPLPARPPIGGD